MDFKETVYYSANWIHLATEQAPVVGSLTHSDECLCSTQWPNKRLLASKHGLCFNELVTSNCPDNGMRCHWNVGTYIPGYTASRSEK